ncbi:hypothetical protein YPHTV1_00025 [Halomonas phage YPHTV-1]|nr:hypothetical protein YPHTV1_00025 [Halomonas phage YPHTV-1]
MKVFIRKTAQGSEYWDNKEKRTLFVPAGKKPGFEVTEDPESMVGGVDLATGKDKTVIDGKIVDDDINLDDMNKEQLLAFAEQNEIDVPGNMSKEETIRNHIANNLAADE